MQMCDGAELHINERFLSTSLGIHHKRSIVARLELFTYHNVADLVFAQTAFH